MWVDDKRVAVSFTGLTGYPARIPYDPPERYPEYRGSSIDPENHVYEWVRRTLCNLGLDRENFNQPNWNPLKGIIEPGMTVFIKPNTVRHHHLKDKDIFSMLTHGSVVRPMLDYIRLALKDEGKIILGDSQVVWGDFDKAWAITGIGPLVEWYRSQTPIEIQYFDLRMVRAARTWMGGRWGRAKVEKDPDGYRPVDLGEKSFFKDIDPKRLRIGIASHKELYRRHSNGHHEYVFPASLLKSNAIINIPKLKTHRRGGVTLALKGFFGLVSRKECLPHWRLGSPEEGGDQYPNRSFRKRLQTHVQDQLNIVTFPPAQFLFAVLREAIWATRWIVPFKDNVTEAMWYGNDTIWRTLLDVYRGVLYSDENGTLHDTPQRNHFCLLDGIVAGERDGPISPDPVYPGVLIAGSHPVAVDTVASSLMGFDVDKLLVIKNAIALADELHPTSGGLRNSIEVIDDGQTMGLAEFEAKRNLGFEPHPHWKDHLERR